METLLIATNTNQVYLYVLDNPPSEQRVLLKNRYVILLIDSLIDIWYESVVVKYSRLYSHL